MSKLLSMPELFAAIAAHGLRKMTEVELQGFAGVEGDGYIVDGNDGETIAVIDVLEESTVVQVFTPELQPLAAEFHMVQNEVRTDIPGARYATLKDPVRDEADPNANLDPDCMTEGQRAAYKKLKRRSSHATRR